MGVPRETADGERRVALVPQVVGRLRSRGLTAVVEPGAGLGALIPDEQFTAAGAVPGDAWAADVVLTVTPPDAGQVRRLRRGAVPRARSAARPPSRRSASSHRSSTPGTTVVHHHVTVTAPLNLAASMPEHASDLYARNVVALLELMLDDTGALVPERIAGEDDDVLVGACATREGRD
ncbi:MAG: hypothetical protein ACXWYP_06085 [Pseudonocardia sp.]